MFSCLRVGCHDLASKFFCLTVLKPCVEEPFCVSKKLLVQRKSFWIRKRVGGRTEYQDFESDHFSRKAPKIHQGNASVVQKVLGIEDFHAKDGEGCHEFPSDFLSHTTKTFVWELLFDSENLVVPKSF